MRRSIILALVLSALLAACGKSREAQLIGTWTGQGLSFTFAEDKTYTSTLSVPGINSIVLEGTWTFQDPAAVATTTKANGMPIDEAAKQAEDLAKSNPIAAQFVQGIGDLTAAIKKPLDMTLSEDAKTLTLKSPLNGENIQLTKSEAK